MSSFKGVWPIFGRDLHNELNTFCGNANTDNTFVANQ